MNMFLNLKYINTYDSWSLHPLPSKKSTWDFMGINHEVCRNHLSILSRQLFKRVIAKKIHTNQNYSNALLNYLKCDVPYRFTKWRFVCQRKSPCVLPVWCEIAHNLELVLSLLFASRKVLKESCIYALLFILPNNSPSALALALQSLIYQDITCCSCCSLENMWS